VIEDAPNPVWQLRSRLDAAESERKAQAATIDNLVRECRQNRERAQKAHERIDMAADDLTDVLDGMNAAIADCVKRMEAMEERFEAMKQWVLERVPNEKGNGK
jgi:uncharacterized coiled-coil DUF342 family protein